MSYWNVPIHPVVVPVLSLLEAAFFALGGLCLGGRMVIIRTVRAGALVAVPHPGRAIA